MMEHRERWPDLYSQWKAGGGIGDVDFLAWVCAVHGYKPTREEINQIQDATKGNISALAELAKRPLA